MPASAIATADKFNARMNFPLRETVPIVWDA